MSKVIMLGGEGVGKSILLTVLAQTYRGKNGSEYFLEAKNKEAALFSQLNWHLLTERREWPPPTPPSAYKKLLWQLHLSGNNPRAVDLVCSDFAGETFRSVFGKDDSSSPDATELVGHIQTADAILVLINLAFLLDENDIERRVENDWAIKSCLDRIAKCGDKRYCIIFTQIDRYYNLFAEVDNSCRRLLDKYFPQIAGVYSDIDIIPVAAVNKTDLADGDEGMVREIPGKDFGSDNLDEIMKWISRTTESTLPHAATTAPALNSPPLPAVSLAESAQIYAKQMKKAFMWGWIFVIALAFCAMIGSNSNDSSSQFWGIIACILCICALLAFVTSIVRWLQYLGAKITLWNNKSKAPKRV